LDHVKTYRVWQDGEMRAGATPGKVAGITTTGIYGRLDCTSGMRAKRSNRVFFHSADDAERAGFRPCKLCKPRGQARAGETAM
jgi:AraC family transcriptional regulator of adaptative response/methylated-DNA-[protein]-cysteine methyltransferase